MRASRTDTLLVGALVLLGALAFVHLTALPAFEDEGSQLRWIWRSIEAGEWLLPLGEGKPLEAWPMVPLVRLGLEPLAVIRAVHVVAGILGSVLTYRLALMLTDRWTAFACGVLFAICPLVVYLQRLALSDILMCAAGLWVLSSGLRLLQSATWTRALGLAAALLLAALCKMPVGFVFLMAIPLALLLMPGTGRRPWLQQPRLTRLMAAHAPATLLALLVAMVALARWRHGQSPGFGVQDLVGIGLGRYQINLPRPNLLRELATQLSWPVLLLAGAGLAASALSRDWRQRWLIAQGGLPMLAIGLLASFWYSRYLLFTLPPLLVAAVCGWQALALSAGRWRRPLQLGLLAIGVGFMVVQSARLILEPQAARWSAVDRYQYFEGPGSGYGFPQAAQYILHTRNPPVTIFSLDGHSAYQLRNYLPRQWGTRVRPIMYAEDGSVLKSEQGRMQNLLGGTPVWIIVAAQLLHPYLDASFGPQNSALIGLREVAAFDKPGGHSQLALYEVMPR